MNTPTFESLQLPVLDNQSDPKHVFTPQELARCASGDCMRCGRCCFLYRVIVPRTFADASYNPNLKPWFIEKGSKELCPQHGYDKEGLSTCACHDQKEMPIMDGCSEFEAGPDVYLEVKAHTRQALYRIENLQQLMLMEDWAKRGLLSDVQIAPSSFDELTKAILGMLKVADHFPSELLNSMGALDILHKADAVDFLKFDEMLKSVCSAEIYAEWDAYTESIEFMVAA